MKIFKWLLAGVGLIMVILSVSFVTLLGPKNRETTESKIVTITAGESRHDIAEKLSREGLIKSSFAFFFYSRLLGGTVLPGPYELSANQSGSDIAEQLRLGKIKTAKIVLIEGWRATDIEDYLVNEKKLDQMIGFAAVAEKDEGYLFPDTYEIKIDETVEGLIVILKENFAKRTEKVKPTPAQVNLASIIEREAKTDEERSQIAGVYANRLKINMLLQADPTIQYAKGNWKAVTVAEYQTVISPYNTYLHKGLPPTPIANPGLKSIEAAVNPAVHDYYYFFHAKGQIFYSKTNDEHVAKVRQNF